MWITSMGNHGASGASQNASVIVVLVHANNKETINVSHYPLLRESTGWLIEDEWRIYASVNYTIIGSDNGLSPDRHQSIIWTSAGILLIGPLGTNFSGILIETRTFSFKKMHLNCRLRNGLNVLKTDPSFHVMTSLCSPPQDSSGGLQRIHYTLGHTVRYRYNAVNFLENIHRRHSLVRPRDMGVFCDYKS